LTRRLVALLATLVAGLGAPGPLVAPAGAASKAPKAVDCASMACDAVMPAAASFRPVEGSPHWEALDADGDVIGWIALSTEFVDIKAYSGKPMVTLVGLDSDGIITGARVVHHSEPILLIGIPEKALHEFVDFYAGKRALQRIVVGRARKPDVVEVDAISGATVTALVQNQTVLDTARALGALVGIFEAGHMVSGHFVAEAEPWSWDRMLKDGALASLVVTEAQMGESEAPTPVVDLFFGVVDAPHIGRALLGDRTYEHHMAKLAEGEHLFVIFNRGEGSFKGSAFVRGGIFDRVRLQQGLREITFRDTDYWNMPDVMAEGAPEISEGALFVLRGGHFDPSAPYELVYLGSRYDQRGAFSRDFREFTASHLLPETLYVVDEVTSGIPWRQAWLNRRIDIIVLCVYLLAVVAVFGARRWTTADPNRIKNLHRASLVFGLLVIGVYMRAQPSVTQIFTGVGSAIGEWRWSLFLSEPLIFILWIFITGVSLVWGRGVFCGWVCPYGAMTEFAFKISERLGFKGYELPDRVHLPLRYLRYGILVVLIAVYLWDSILGERLAEVEPFKSTFLVPAWTRHWGFLAWWIALLAISFVMYRPFCRYICPLGGGLSLMSSLRPSGPRRRAFCTSCKICTRGCEPRAFRKDGSIDPRECLSCMDCEATYRNEMVCPPLVGIARLESRDELGGREREKLDLLQIEVRDV
jgi:NosR/NirI family nitrous oxide reductase transcriptional regulator